MKLTSRSHSAFRIEAGAAKILIDPFLSDNPSWDKGWIGPTETELATAWFGTVRRKHDPREELVDVQHVFRPSPGRVRYRRRERYRHG